MMYFTYAWILSYFTRPILIFQVLKATLVATSFRRSVPFCRGGFQLRGPYGEGRIRLHLAAYATRSCKHPIIESAAFLWFFFLQPLLKHLIFFPSIKTLLICHKKEQTSLNDNVLWSAMSHFSFVLSLRQSCCGFTLVFFFPFFFSSDNNLTSFTFGFDNTFYCRSANYGGLRESYIYIHLLSESWQSIQLSGWKIIDPPSYDRYYLEPVANISLLEPGGEICQKKNKKNPTTTNKKNKAQFLSAQPCNSLWRGGETVWQIYNSCFFFYSKLNHVASNLAWLMICK